MMKHLSATDSRFANVTEEMCRTDHLWMKGALSKVADTLSLTNRGKLKNAVLYTTMMDNPFVSPAEVYADLQNCYSSP